MNRHLCPCLEISTENLAAAQQNADRRQGAVARALARLAMVILVALYCALPGRGEVVLREVAGEWGVEFRHRHGGSGHRYLVETMVGGLVAFDYDGDGDVDLFFVDGGQLPGYEGVEPRSRLLRNEGGQFVDRTDPSGISVLAYGSGASAADVDGDGDLDLYVTAFGANQLFTNLGDGSFEDSTEQAGVGEELWSSGSSFADVDRDGDLDLYVVNYVDFRLDNHKVCSQGEKKLQSYCHPDTYNGEPDRFYRNRGDGTFDEATEAAGFGKTPAPGLGVVFGDLTNDGWPDLYVANDLMPNFFFVNRGDGTFDDQSLLSGAAYSDAGNAEAGMGIDLADLDGNGYLDVFVTNFELETNALYRNMGSGLFLDNRHPIGLAEPSFLKLAFGVAFADLDQDGDEDLVVANGHVSDNAEELGGVTPYRQQNQVFVNTGGRFQESETVGMHVIRASRGLVTGDLDRDGDLDVVILNSNDDAEVYSNVSSEKGGFFFVDLSGSSSGRFGIGTRLELLATGRVQRREIKTGSSYLSQNPLSAHFGLGEAKEVDSLTLRWPLGKVQRFKGLAVNHRIRVSE